MTTEIKETLERAAVTTIIETGNFFFNKGPLTVLHESLKVPSMNAFQHFKSFFKVINKIFR